MGGARKMEKDREESLYVIGGGGGDERSKMSLFYSHACSEGTHELSETVEGWLIITNQHCTKITIP